MWPRCVRRSQRTSTRLPLTLLGPCANAGLVFQAHVPITTQHLIDRCMQAFGGMGISQDTPLFAGWAGARTLRLADGPDEVWLTHHPVCAILHPTPEEHVGVSGRGGTRARGVGGHTRGGVEGVEDVEDLEGVEGA